MSKYWLVWIGSVFILGLSFMFPLTEVYAKSIQISIPFGDHDKNLRTVVELYSPVNHVVDIGDSVTWTNDDKIQHTVTSGTGVGLYGFVGGKTESKPDGKFSSGIIEPGNSWSFTFKQSGYFAYFCEIHPWIERSITVQEPGVNVLDNFRVTYTMILSITIIVAIISGTLIFMIKRKKMSG
ncbi:MAG: hypothetical protein EPO63_00675 [Candidatus Nitrosotenuis sp.]|nr:MAG: hypothetical protein EPO63_00675 [Candidatus Nitrosotenuis sp.]